MDRVSKPLIGVLVATVAVFALWVVALKPSSSSNSPNGTGGGLGQFQSDINKAHQAVQTSNAANAAAGAVPTTTSQLTTAPPTAQPGSKSSSASASATSSSAQPSAKADKAPATPAARFSTVQKALDQHKVVALLFYNPTAADDKAVKQELGLVPAHSGKVVKLAVPLTELSKYTAVTQQVPVNVSPTLVVIGRDGQAGEIVGFTDKVEIAQRVADGLAASPK
jgi:hypothetical protein